MTKTYCTAAVCYKSNITARGAKRDCTHPEGPGKLESPRTPSTCPLTIKYTLTPENAYSFIPFQLSIDPPINDIEVIINANFR